MDCENCGTPVPVYAEDGDYSYECPFCGQSVENGVETKKGKQMSREWSFEMEAL